MTERQQPLLDYVHAHYEAQGAAPTTTDVLKAFRYRNEAGVLRGLEALVVSGHLVQARGRWRLPEPAVQLHFELSTGAEARTPLR